MATACKAEPISRCFSVDGCSIDLNCNPCSYGNIIVRATHFCKTCEDPEPLCESCAAQHGRHKISRHHQICENIGEFPKEHTNTDEESNLKEITCVPCSFENVQVKAAYFCQTCEDPEPLCETCATQHTRQKLTRGHEIGKDIWKYFKLRSILGENNQHEKEVECDQCSIENIHIKATHFCKTCDDPEPLCDECAKQHTRQKICRDHEMCKNLLEFLRFRSKNRVDSQQEVYIECDHCLNDGTKVTATHFCKTCEDPEPLCETCVKHHTRQKAFRNHEISENINKFPIHHLNKSGGSQQEEDMTCDPCLNDGTKVTGTHFCKTCEDPEPLCETCAKQHTRQKAFRDHEVSRTIHEFQKHRSKKRNTAENLETFDDKYPGKPKAIDIKSDSIRLFWRKSVKQADHYQIRFKTKDGNMKWKITETDSDENNIIITGLMANKIYIFQVRGIFGDQEGPYGPVTDDIETTTSLATTLLGFSVLQSNTNSPQKYLLPVEENKSARNTTARTRMLTLGKPTPYFSDEKTIMLLGAIGSGKSTLVDCIVNYILGVSFDDPFRFSIVTLEEEEKNQHNQVFSQTEWITVYKLYPAEGSRLSYTLNIIDTPGFGDTRGIGRDNAIVDRIRHLFSAQGEQGVLHINAVCFIVKASDVHLTVVQRYIFSSIMSLFGKNVESNIFTLITFADGADPTILASLMESKLPFGLTFNFNNSALFAENKDRIHNKFSQMFWEMGCSSFEILFGYIKQLETRSLCQTKNVLDERERLKLEISNIRQQVSAGLSKLSELQQQLDIFKRYKNEIKANKNFEYEVQETKQIAIGLPRGQHVTNCIQCCFTCHEDCSIADDEKKRNCKVIDKLTGLCTICNGKCIWSVHKNTSYIFKYVTETVKKTYAKMKERYEAALGQSFTHETYIEQLMYDVENLFENINAMINKMNECKTRLKEIALRPDPLTAVEHIDLLIQSEEIEKQPGFLKRVQMLKEIKRKALVDPDVNTLGQNIRVTRETIKSVTVKNFSN